MHTEERPTTQNHRIDTFPWDEAAAALDYAATIGASVEPIPYDPQKSSGGYHSITHPCAEGLTVQRWSGAALPHPATLTRLDRTLPGDVVWSSHRGRVTVSENLYVGKPTGYLRFVGDMSLEAGDADNLIPLIERPTRATPQVGDTLPVEMQVRHLRRGDIFHSGKKVSAADSVAPVSDISDISRLVASAEARTQYMDGTFAVFHEGAQEPVIHGGDALVRRAWRVGEEAATNAL